MSFAPILFRPERIHQQLDQRFGGSHRFMKRKRRAFAGPQLRAAARRGDLKLLKEIISTVSTPNALALRGCHGESALHVAAAAGERERERERSARGRRSLERKGDHP